MPAGVSDDDQRPDNIVYDVAPDGDGHPISAGGFGHPHCVDEVQESAGVGVGALPAVPALKLLGAPLEGRLLPVGTGGYGPVLVRATPPEAGMSAP